MNVKKLKQDLLDRLYEPYKKCYQCPLGKLGRTHVVFGEGNPDAQIMFVGEGPGKNEDLQGRPFVGRAGKLLNQTLEKISIKRKDVFITNIVKCRPPNNRNPEPKEINTCKNILLYNQIKIINPTIIITLGAIAATALLNKDIKISKIRGKMNALGPIDLLPTYHPAYILRNPKAYDLFFDDLKLAKEYIQKNILNK